MEKEIDYKKLYELQDKILLLLFGLENDFYLTGGTALHRFYYNARYSDDLDFFVSNGNNFSEDVKEIMDELCEDGFEVQKVVSSRDFYRVMVNDLLQLDFINDRVYRYKKSNIIDTIRVDNKINILTNKLGAIVDRDEEKDIFDLFCLVYHEIFNWDEVLKITNKKTVVEKDILIYRLNTFPLKWLGRIKRIKKINISKSKIDTLCNDILYGNDNSLAGEVY